MTDNTNKILTAGFAQFPKGTPIYETQKVIGCILVIDTEKEMIADVSFTFLSELTRDFLSSLLIGKSLSNGLDEVIKELETKIFFVGKKAVIQAVISACQQYYDLKES